MKLIIGLGNPEPRFKLNRHNTGFILVDAYISGRKLYDGFVKTSGGLVKVSCGIVAKQPVVILKPQDWMNSSGKSAGLVKSALQVENKDILLIHDDMDFEFGEYKLKSSGSGGNHNGVKSVIDSIGKDFNRFRIGIGRPRDEQTAYDYVLSDFETNELKWFCDLVSLTTSIVDGFIEHGAQWAMNTFNRSK